jgi:hypothetical protein
MPDIPPGDLVDPFLSGSHGPDRIPERREHPPKKAPDGGVLMDYQDYRLVHLRKKALRNFSRAPLSKTQADLSRQFNPRCILVEIEVGSRKYLRLQPILRLADHALAGFIVFGTTFALSSLDPGSPGRHLSLVAFALAHRTDIPTARAIVVQGAREAIRLDDRELPDVVRMLTAQGIEPDLLWHAVPQKAGTLIALASILEEQDRASTAAMALEDAVAIAATPAEQFAGLAGAAYGRRRLPPVWIAPRSGHRG